jgi:hypothetical protein
MPVALLQSPWPTIEEPDGIFGRHRRPLACLWVSLPTYFAISFSRSSRSRISRARYPLPRAGDPPAMTFLNGSGKAIDTIFSDNYEYFESLGALVEKEPVDGCKKEAIRGRDYTSAPLLVSDRYRDRTRSLRLQFLP